MFYNTEAYNNITINVLNVPCNRIIKNILKNEIVCRDIISKPKKVQEQDDFGNKMKYHFHITTIHK